MDEMLKTISKMSNEEQVKIFKELESKLGTETTNALRERMFYIKLFTDNNFYSEAVYTLGNRIYTEINAGA